MCREQQELLEQLVAVNQHLEAEREAYEREREVLGLLCVEMTRHLQAMQNAVERAKTRIAGITPHGASPSDHAPTP